MDALVHSLKAAAEPTRLRLLAACADGELTVSELCQILGQSQPRISRHLKLLGEAGLLGRSREGNFAFFRLADRGAGAALARTLVAALPQDDSVIQADRTRLAAIRAARAERASAYFRANAARWNELRRLGPADAAVERALLDLLPTRIGTLLDIGTGTGRMLQLLGKRAERGIGIDLSREMLALARAALDTSGLAHCQVRQADMTRLPFPDGWATAAICHQVLHYADDPALAVAEAARVLSPGGTLVIADLAPHDMERLRTEHAHRRLGLSDEEVEAWAERAGLRAAVAARVPGDPLSVVLWTLYKPAAESAARAVPSPDRFPALADGVLV